MFRLLLQLLQLQLVVLLVMMVIVVMAVLGARAVLLLDGLLAEPQFRQLILQLRSVEVRRRRGRRGDGRRRRREKSLLLTALQLDLLVGGRRSHLENESRDGGLLVVPLIVAIGVL